MRSEALAETANSEVEGDAIFRKESFSFSDSDDQNMFDCLNDDAFVPNIGEQKSYSEKFEPTIENKINVEEPCAKN